MNPSVSLTALAIVEPQLIGDTISVNSNQLTLVFDADLNTTRLSIAAYGQTTFIRGYVNDGNKNRFTATIQLSQTWGAEPITVFGQNYDQDSWQPRTSYLLGDTIISASGEIWTCIKSGISGTSIPVWNSGTGNLTLDGSGSTQVTWSSIGGPAITPTFNFSLIYYDSADAVSVAPPSGVRIYRGQSKCKIEWATPSEQNALGVRVMLSTDPSGVDVPYKQYGGLIGTTPTRADIAVLASSSETEVVSDSETVITTTQTTQPVTFCSVEVNYSDIGTDKFYALLSTVVHDTVTNRQYESQQNGPFTCGFVNLKLVNPTDFLALQQKEDFATRMLTNITKGNPNLDLSPRSEIPDVIVDPISIELSNLSVREWFARCSQSLSAMVQIDDANDDGISDTYQSSPIKQLLATVFNLSPQSVQALIDKQFDIIGAQQGVLRGGSTASLVNVTFFTYQYPTSSVTFNRGTIVGTAPDANTPSVTFTTTATASVDAGNPKVYYNAEQGWWSVTVPAQCNTPGSIGNVGANTIRQLTTGVAAGWYVTNQFRADYGLDRQDNISYAEVLMDAILTGKDSGTRRGYLKAARETPGITQATVVAAGDLQMLRDWDPIRAKHVNGCVDIYARGTAFSEQAEETSFTYQTVNQVPLKIIGTNPLKLSIGTTFSLTPYTITSILVVGSTSFYLGVQNAQIDTENGNIILDPNEFCYQIGTDVINYTVQPYLIGSVPATNLKALSPLFSAKSNANILCNLRLQAPMKWVPTLQPVLSISSVTGEVTGAMDPALTHLIHTTDFYLAGGSSSAGDTILVPSNVSTPTTQTVTFPSTGSQVLLGQGMDISVDQNGVLGDVLSVRSSDQTVLYQKSTDGTNGDYLIVPPGIPSSSAFPVAGYRQYAIKLTANTTIPVNQAVLVAYKQFNLVERLILRTDPITLKGIAPVKLTYSGLINNVWLPESYGLTTLSLNQQFVSANIAHENRWLKVTYDDGQTTRTLTPGVDFLTTNDAKGNWSIARTTYGAIPDGATVTLSYYTNEDFTIKTQYPSYVEQLATSLSVTKHAAADVLVKAMVSNPVDMSFTVVLDPMFDATVTDSGIRSSIGLTMDRAKTWLYQSVLSQAIQGIPGVTSIHLPLTRCAKADGSYDIGVIIPVGTVWNKLTEDPDFASLSTDSLLFITASWKTPNPTIPSGGTADNYVGVLYEGQAYQRTNSIQAFLNSRTPSFYIIGTNDYIAPGIPVSGTHGGDFTNVGRVLLRIPSFERNDPLAFQNPSELPWYVTYQVFGQTGAQDIAIASTETVRPGNIVVNYITKSA